MGNSSSTTFKADVCVHAFQLDKEISIFGICGKCGKQPRFFAPDSWSDHLAHYISFDEVTKVIEDLNNLLQDTGFNYHMTNPLLWICMTLGFLITLFGILFRPFSSILDDHMENGTDYGGSDYHMHNDYNTDYESGNGTSDVHKNTMKLMLNVIGPIILGILPIFCYCGICCSFKIKRKTQLTEYVDQWNSKTEDRGVRLSLGGEVVRILTRGRFQAGPLPGSEQGGGWENFELALWPARNLSGTAYLYIYVNVNQWQEWCRINGKLFVMPLPRNQNMAPAGYLLVPQPQFQVPAGYALVPQDQVNLKMETVPPNPDVPPTYEKSK